MRNISQNEALQRLPVRRRTYLALAFLAALPLLGYNAVPQRMKQRGVVLLEATRSYSG